MLPGSGVYIVVLKYHASRNNERTKHVKKYNIIIIFKFKYIMFDKWKMSIALKIASKLILQKIEFFIKIMYYLNSCSISLSTQ